MPDPAVVVLDADIARWLGHHAARRGCFAAGRSLVPDDLHAAYDDGAIGADSDPQARSPQVRLTQARRKVWLRAIEAAADPRPAEQITSARVDPLPATILHLVQRADVGTATRYDLTLGPAASPVVLRDLRGADLLTWERLRPIALDARLVLPSLTKGQRPLWLAEVQRAVAGAECVQLDDEDSDAMEIRSILRQLTEAARTWTWTEEDTYPRGIARILYAGLDGWPRGPLVREVRAALGRVSRVSLRRARADLGWVSRDWRIETAYLRVWARPSTSTPWWPAT